MEVILFPLIGLVIMAIAMIANHHKRGNAINSLTLNLEAKGFKITKQVTDPDNKFSLLVDDINHKWAILNSHTQTADIYNYKDLIEYEVLEDGDSIVKGRVGSVIVGGLLLGGIGAIAGASRKKKVKSICNSMSVRILTNNFNHSQYVIPLISGQTKTNSIIYQGAQEKAQEISSVLAIIKARAEAQ